MLGPTKAGWNVNRYPVTYGMPFSLAGVGVLTSSSPRGIAVAAALVQALNDEGVLSFILPEKRVGCEDIESLKNVAETDPACSAISVFVGDHP